jgi:dTDP-4-dehydrorhamnose 3,5-epimerase
LKGVDFFAEKQIFHEKGDIFHAMKSSSNGFSGFGEAYFTTIHRGKIKGWKKHTRMVLNLIVPVGEVEFVVGDGKEFESFQISKNNYGRLRVEPNLWVAFRGIGDENLVLNIASIPHDPNESENIELENFNYKWSEK